VRLGAFEADQRHAAARAQRALSLSAGGRHIDVIDVLIVAAQHHEGLTAGKRGWPLQRALKEAWITRGRERGAGEEREGKGGSQELHGSRTSTRSVLAVPE